MSIVLDGTAGITFPVVAGSTSAVQASSGKVLQVVNTLKSTAFSTTSTSFTDITGLSASITPSSSTSKILILVTVGASGSADDSLVQLVRGATVIASGSGGSVTDGFNMFTSNTNSITDSSINYVDSPSTTSSTTYTVQILTRSGTVYVNRRASNASFSGSSSITVMEIAA